MGTAEPPITNEIARTALANRIGDEGIDILAHYDKQFWPPLMLSELPGVVKKLANVAYQQCVYLMRDHAGTWAEVCAMPDIERVALYYACKIDDGWTVDWDTGDLTPPRRYH